MSHAHSVANTIEYGRALVQAGVTGVQQAQPAPEDLRLQLAHATSSGIKAAAVSGGIALLGCKLGHNRTRIGRTALVFAGCAFCAEFLWKSRAVSANLISGVRKEVSKVRDQHWLESNPVDYA